MENQQKEAIRASLRNYVAKYPSQNKAAQSLRGTSSATISAILSGKWENISDEMWRNIQSQTSTQTAEDWQIVATASNQELHYAMDDAQRWHNVTWVVGEAGCGKTTAINCILSLLKYDKGEIRIFDEPMRPDAFAIKRKIGLVPQEVSVYYDFTVKQNIDYFCGLYIDNGAERKKLVKEAIYRSEYTKTVSSPRKASNRKLSLQFPQKRVALIHLHRQKYLYCV